MFLEKLLIKKFRSISQLELRFNKGVNIIIGENNSGKSAIIDALRICLSLSKQWRDIGIRNQEDFYIDVSEIKDSLEPIEFHLTFKIEAPEDAQRFLSMVYQNPADPNDQNIQIHFKYYLENTTTGSKVLRWSIWGGNVEGQQVKSEEAQLIYFSYLAPLRNAEQELRPYAKENKIISLFKEMTKFQVNENGTVITKELNIENKKALAKKLETVIQDQEWLGLIKSGENLVNEHLEQADISKKGSRIHLRLLEYEYNNIVKGMLMRRPVYDDLLLGDDKTRQLFFDVNQNGLGENNLIYASAVLGDLKNRRADKKEHYYALLIEEPEAHLHPQKQNTFFNYLGNLKDLEVQLFVTSHSPTLTAKSNLNNLFVLQKQNNVIRSFSFLESELTEENKSHLRKFLDVTKSQLFFANGVLLVEGISEALLIPALISLTNEEINLDRNGIEMVNINGVAFEPFAKLFNSTSELKRLPSRCSIVTDDDQGLIKSGDFVNPALSLDKEAAKNIFKILQQNSVIDSNNRIRLALPTTIDLQEFQVHEAFIRSIIDTKMLKKSDRAERALQLQNGNLKTKTAEITFEFELAAANDYNFRLMKLIYQKMHPQTTFSSEGTKRNRILDFLDKLISNKDKSIFAENLALVLESRPSARKYFKAPTYIIESVNWVVKGQ